jgi:hypothetical protein
MSTVRREVDLKDEIVSKIVKLGCACATDLATELGSGLKPQDLVAPLESLVKSGVLRHKSDSRDDRKYSAPEQTAYELAR